jgi:hypothetical protein
LLFSFNKSRVKNIEEKQKIIIENEKYEEKLTRKQKLEINLALRTK